MGIQLLEGTGTLPTSVRDGFLQIHGLNNSVVASIPLPFKRKFNGPLNAEYIYRPNVMVLTPLDNNLVLVMRFDGSWTIYTTNMIPIFFGEFKKQEFLSPYLTIDPCGSYLCIPPHMKKSRMYKAFLVRYNESKELHYLIESNPNVAVFTQPEDPVLIKILYEGLNSGIRHHPALERKGEEGVLRYKETYPIYYQNLQCTLSSIQENLLLYKRTPERKYTVLCRRRPYAEVEAYAYPETRYPEFLEEILDLSPLKVNNTSDAGATTSTVHYYLSCIMDKYPTMMVGREVDGYLAEFMDHLGNVYFCAVPQYWEGTMSIDEASLRVTASKHTSKLCGYAVQQVSEISVPTMLPRVSCIGQTVFVNGEAITIDKPLASVPDATMVGYQDCVLSSHRAVIYLQDGTYLFV